MRKSSHGSSIWLQLCPECQNGPQYLDVALIKKESLEMEQERIDLSCIMECQITIMKSLQEYNSTHEHLEWW